MMEQSDNPMIGRRIVVLGQGGALEGTVTAARDREDGFDLEVSQYPAAEVREEIHYAGYVTPGGPFVVSAEPDYDPDRLRQAGFEDRVAEVLTAPVDPKDLLGLDLWQESALRKIAQVDQLIEVAADAVHSTYCNNPCPYRAGYKDLEIARAVVPAILAALQNREEGDRD